MGKYRTCFHLALALTLLSLTCDVGAVCAFAGMEGECCCPVKMAGGRSPCTEMSGRDDTTGAPEPDATIGSGERFAAAVLDAAPLSAASGAPSPALGALAPALQAAPTPLFLRHCAFLC